VIPPGPLEVAVEAVAIESPRASEEVILVCDLDWRRADDPPSLVRGALDDIVRRKGGGQIEVIDFGEEPCRNVLKEVVPESALIDDLNAHAR
jgi:hypothetical protein